MNSGIVAIGGHRMVQATTERRTLQTAHDLAEATADWLYRQTLASEGPFAVCLSGGSTPRRLHEALATHGCGSGFPGSRSHWFRGDERLVAHDHSDRNFIAHEAIQCRVPIPRDNIHPFPTGGRSPTEAAATCEASLKHFCGSATLFVEHPLFGMTLLGIGEDGHTPPLISNEPLKERSRWVSNVRSPTGDARISSTYVPRQGGREVSNGQ